jgi:ubiquinone/menaquinone biosynthesis C-methylase UbiE
MSLTIEAYNFISKDYVQLTKDLDNFPSVKKDTNEFMTVMPGKLILDAGAGSCRDTVAFANNGFKVEAIDLAKDILVVANGIYPNVIKRIMDVTKLGYRNNTFDGIWCNAVLLHLDFQDFLQALREFRRVLKKNGLLYISVKEGVGKEIVKAEGSERYCRTFYLKSLDNVKKFLVKTGFEIKSINTRTETFLGIKTKWITAFAYKS